MSFAHLNGTLPFEDVWAPYLANAQSYLPTTNSRLALILLLNAPVVIILLNALWQVVRVFGLYARLYLF